MNMKVGLKFGTFRVTDHDEGPLLEPKAKYFFEKKTVANANFKSETVL